MLKSMTGFGASSFEGDFGSLQVEIQSLNGRFLDVRYYLPKEWFFLEVDLKKWIGNELSRGNVSIRLTLVSKRESSTFLELQKKWEKIARALNRKNEEVTLSFLAERAESVTCNLQAYKKELKKALQEALKKLLMMQKKEGRALENEIKKRIAFLEKELSITNKRAPLSTQEYRERLKKRLLELLQEQMEEKIEREAVLFAEKVDITEELTRLSSHIAQFKGLFMQKEPTGRQMEFLLQEMSREVNTIGSKSQDNTISSSVVRMKTELEKIKEQVQNIE